MYLPHIHSTPLSHPLQYVLTCSFSYLAQWAAGRGFWKSGAAHTVDIYKTTNHRNHRNVLFLSCCQTSCHADHTAAALHGNLNCTTFFFSYCSYYSHPRPLFSFNYLFLCHSVFFHAFLSYSLAFTPPPSCLSVTALCPA